VTVCTRDPAHTRHIRHWYRGGGAGGQVNDPLTVRPWTGNPLRATLADKETIAGTADVLPPRGRVPDGRGLVTGITLDHVLVLLARNVDHVTTNSAGDHGDAPWRHRSVWWRQLIRPYHAALFAPRAAILVQHGAATLSAAILTNSFRYKGLALRVFFTGHCGANSASRDLKREFSLL